MRRGYQGDFLMARDVPIIFSGPMVQALLDGRKTMTRRLAWSRPGKAGRRAIVKSNWPLGMWPSQWQNRAAGDRLCVKEKYAPKAVGWFYETDTDGTVRVAWGNPMYMPRNVSRLTLVVTGTKIERLHSIDGTDAQAEGIEFREGCFGTWNNDGTMRCGGANDAREAFRCLWLNLHGTGTWEANPEVVALTFRVIKANIDAPEARVAA
jgi:hypothetical protein